MDDELFMGSSTDELVNGEASTATGGFADLAMKQNQTQSLKDTIVPLRVEDIFSDHFR